MSQFKAISRANRQMQLDDWTPVDLPVRTLVSIYENHDEIADLQDVPTFLQDWLRSNNVGGFAMKPGVDHSCLTFLFKLSSEAVRFKLTWGGR